MPYKDTFSMTSSEYFNSEIWNKDNKRNNLGNVFFPGKTMFQSIKSGAERGGYFAFFTAKGALSSLYGIFETFAFPFAGQGKKFSRFKDGIKNTVNGITNTVIGAVGAGWNLVAAMVLNGVIVKGSKAVFSTLKGDDKDNKSKSSENKELNKTKKPSKSKKQSFDKSTTKHTDTLSKNTAKSQSQSISK